MPLTALDVDPEAQVPSFLSALAIDSSNGAGFRLTQNSFIRTPRWVWLCAASDFWFSNVDGQDPETGMIRVFADTVHPIQLNPGGKIDVYLKTKTGTATVKAFTAEKGAGGASGGGGGGGGGADIPWAGAFAPVTYTNGEADTMAYGTVVYLSGTNTVKRAQSDGTDAESNAVAICINPGGLGSGLPGLFAIGGRIIALTGGTADAFGYLSPTAGAIEATPDNTVGHFRQTLLQWSSASECIFNPELSYKN